MAHSPVVDQNSPSYGSGIVNPPQPPISFSHPLSIKLDEKNFLLWNQQVQVVITAHKLHRFLVNPIISILYKTEANHALDLVSDAYQRWLVQDQLLFTWLLSSISDSILPRVLGCKRSHQVWDHIHKYFFSLLKAKVRQFHSELKNMKKAQ